jgi:hypothetical protein
MQAAIAGRFIIDGMQVQTRTGHIEAAAGSCHYQQLGDRTDTGLLVV